MHLPSQPTDGHSTRQNVNYKLQQRCNNRAAAGQPTKYARPTGDTPHCTNTANTPPAPDNVHLPSRSPKHTAATTNTARHATHPTLAAARLPPTFPSAHRALLPCHPCTRQSTPLPCCPSTTRRPTNKRPRNLPHPVNKPQFFPLTPQDRRRPNNAATNSVSTHHEKHSKGQTSVNPHRLRGGDRCTTVTPYGDPFVQTDTNASNGRNQRLRKHAPCVKHSSHVPRIRRKTAQRRSDTTRPSYATVNNHRVNCYNDAQPATHYRSFFSYSTAQLSTAQQARRQTGLHTAQHTNSHTATPSQGARRGRPTARWRTQRPVWRRQRGETATGRPKSRSAAPYTDTAKHKQVRSTNKATTSHGVFSAAHTRLSRCQNAHQNGARLLPLRLLPTVTSFCFSLVTTVPAFPSEAFPNWGFLLARGHQHLRPIGSNGPRPQQQTKKHTDKQLPTRSRHTTHSQFAVTFPANIHLPLKRSAISNTNKRRAHLYGHSSPLCDSRLYGACECNIVNCERKTFFAGETRNQP